MAVSNGTPGTTLTGPLEVVAPEGETAFADLSEYIVTAIGNTTTVDQAANITANLNDIKAQLDAIRERLA